MKKMKKAALVLFVLALTLPFAGCSAIIGLLGDESDRMSDYVPGLPGPDL